MPIDPDSPLYPAIDVSLLPGVPGQRGATGPTGPTGPQGSSLTFKGTKATVNDLPATGNVTGDGWIVESQCVT